MIPDPGFRAARRAGSRGLRRVVFPLLVLAVLYGIAQPVSSLDGTEPPLLFLGVVALIGVVGLIMLGTEIRRLVRNRTAWGRAARGAVSLTLYGRAVAMVRTVSGRPMRTVVVEHDGEPRYVHLLFVKGTITEIMRPGQVTVEFFAGSAVEGPARLLLPDGRTLWAFTTRLGERPEIELEEFVPEGVTGESSERDRAGQVAPVGALDDGRGGDRFDSGDGWTGGSSWGSDAGWSGSDVSGGGGGWSGGDFGGGSDSGGGGSGD